MSYDDGPRGPSDHFANINSLNSVGNDFEPVVAENDLALFTNSEFFDWDVNDPVDPSFEALSAPHSADGTFPNHTFNFSEISQIPNDSFDPQLPQQASWIPQPEQSSATQATQPQQQLAQQPAPRRRADTATRASSSAESPAQPEGDALHVSAEEDKRRRNTAASARFRVKKKQREQAMEKTAKDMTDRVQHLESRVAELEKENRLLKGLLTEKGAASAKAEDGSRKRVKREVDSP